MKILSRFYDMIRRHDLFHPGVDRQRGGRSFLTQPHFVSLKVSVKACNNMSVCAVSA
ncbi:hypothetical protein [Morganella psychrotolerans]|uniref:hypothetical protein n=1 Tax=Morganella psychrotolerans TaxID=368603 RepID=UPI0039AF57C4